MYDSIKLGISRKMICWKTTTFHKTHPKYISTSLWVVFINIVCANFLILATFKLSLNFLVSQRCSNCFAICNNHGSFCHEKHKRVNLSRLFGLIASSFFFSILIFEYPDIDFETYFFSNFLWFFKSFHFELIWSDSARTSSTLKAKFKLVPSKITTFGGNRNLEMFI